MRKTVVINIVGLTPRLIGANTPALARFRGAGGAAAIEPVVPAVTCTAQATYLTGRLPDGHGIVGNGWYFRDECEIRFWRQSNRLVEGPKLWDIARSMEPSFTCANLFWWYNMYSSVDWSVTPRPMYPADGRKIPDIYTQPGELRGELQDSLGTFPLFDFWGPRSSIRSSAWIADSAIAVERKFNPTLTLIYLPHLDYALQRWGTADARAAQELRAVDAEFEKLWEFYTARGASVVVVSEYGITDVRTPVHINRVLREKGLIRVREELGHELLDPGASAAFAVADHQVAHVYVKDSARIVEIQSLLEGTPGIERVLDGAGKRAFGLDHPRSGELIALAAPDAWFTYYYWLDDRRAPDFARTVDIHRKPGYDPAELFLDPSIRLVKARIGMTLLKKALGFRTLLTFIPLDASLVRGSHGRPSGSAADGPLLMSDAPELLTGERYAATAVRDVLLRHVFGSGVRLCAAAPAAC